MSDEAADQEVEDRIVFAYPFAVFCGQCGKGYRRLAVSNEICTGDYGGLLGIESVVRFDECGHEVPDASADPVAVAHLLNMMEDSEESTECP